MESRSIEVVAIPWGQRLDRFMAQTWPDHSRSFWQRQIDAGHVLVDGKMGKAGNLVKNGQVVTVRLEEEPDHTEVDLAMSPSYWPDWVVYHDAAVIVVNKPRHLVVHPSAGHWDDSVVQQLGFWISDVPNNVRPGVVHRLDRDTSGLMVIARTAQARDVLSAAIRARDVTRQYVAVVRGVLKPAVGLIDAPIGRDRRHRLKMTVTADGRSARTYYRTLAQWTGFSLVQCGLETGRTHQIRVHLAWLGHPVVGDFLYGGRHPAFTQGQLLHAGRLLFSHPTRDELMEFFAPVPADWNALASLGTAHVIDPLVYPGTTQPLTHHWLSSLGVFAVADNS
jgi:23S rRNA pseudouridine1911/1915/1917 synthase